MLAVAWPSCFCTALTLVPSRIISEAAVMMHAMDMAEVIRRRRAELGLSQADLAKAAGVDTRQIRRYEAGQQQPVLSVAVAIANALGICVSELAGMPTHRVSLTGDWWTCWQAARGRPSRKVATCGAASCACGTTRS
jgi:DNA-binding XRE family transcriptional regulator